MNVVIIDNNIEQLDYIADIVRGIYPGSVVSAFRDPMLAVKHVYNNATDIVLSEVRTRPVSGFDVLRNLHRIKPDMLVVLLAEDESNESKAREYGADGFLTKPVMKDNLQELMDRLIG